MGEFYPHGSPEAEAWKAAVAQQADAKDRRIAALEAELARVTGERDRWQAEAHRQHELVNKACDNGDATDALLVQAIEAGRGHLARAEQAEAQVATLLVERNNLLFQCDEQAAQVAAMEKRLRDAGLTNLNLPQSAARLLAAERVAEASQRIRKTSDALNGSGINREEYRQAWADACKAHDKVLDEWLRLQATAPAEVAEHG